MNEYSSTNSKFQREDSFLKLFLFVQVVSFIEIVDCTVLLFILYVLIFILFIFLEKNN